MRTSFLILVFTVFLTSCASKTSFNSFYSENKKECNFSISTPAFLVNMFIPKEDFGPYKHLFKNVKRYKIMVLDGSKNSVHKNLNRFISDKKYSTLVKIKDKNTHVHFFYSEKNKTIHEIVLKIVSEKELVIVGLKTNISRFEFDKILDESNSTTVLN